MSHSSIIRIKAMSFPWETSDPFLFCAHHADAYPKGNDALGPDAPLTGRNIGQDFVIKDGWRMYHGSKVPGFPSHPHRGFETVTIAKEGLVDHSDSLGAAGRFGNGDVQWMTAGRGVQHAEMFPLLNKEKDNPLEIFQIWLNLPKKDKFVEPHFAMLWAEEIPFVQVEDDQGRKVEINIISGNIESNTSPAPAPNSWAADGDNEVLIWTIKMSPGAEYVLPPSKGKVSRTLYFYKGNQLKVDGEIVEEYHAAELVSTDPTRLVNGSEEGYLLLLQGKPIGEPVAQHGPFVMNSQSEITQTINDYQRTEFGGWPWPSRDHVHPREKGRFAKHADGREEIK